ncbi:hypothetical protein DPMN_124515 [Dreissena polymorpha]|uniref:Uncharacterized protein n=1 Tax=Dreissena polymorpha TaxID=45954 RepID=A0A9D4JS86_DREPO|nr:hypothetical protein DPMN_124515 [Dreissena polymorpha]
MRLSEQQADEEDIQKLGKYIKQNIEQIRAAYYFVDRREFVILRNSVFSRLNLFNARHGGQPSRLQISQYQPAKESG